MEQGLSFPAGPEGHSHCCASCVGSSVWALPHEAEEINMQCSLQLCSRQLFPKQSPGETGEPLGGEVTQELGLSEFRT